MNEYYYIYRNPCTYKSITFIKLFDTPNKEYCTDANLII